MRIEWDLAVTMDDGSVLRADVFRPDDDARYPVILSYGPYAKGLSFQEGYPDQWRRMIRNHPDVAAGSSNRYQAWEVVDPEKWIPHGYACVRVDSRGAGRSPGIIDPFSRRETEDIFQCIAWAAAQPWSSGKVGLNGISYYAINQWQVAARRPPALAAMCAWEGAMDFYRDHTYHGGILCSFAANWYDKQVKTVQHGLGSRGPRHPVTGVNACGDEDLSEEVLAANRVDYGQLIASHPFDDAFHRERSGNPDLIDTPLLSAGNWGGHGLHLRGNVEGFLGSKTEKKWLEIHGLEHWSLFYTDYGRELQLQFFDHFLKGVENGWADRPRVQLQVRHVDKFVPRAAPAWPLPETNWTRFYLAPAGLSETARPDAGFVSFAAGRSSATISTKAFDQETEITGPSALRVFISSSTEDADIFAVLRLFDPDGAEVTFQGALEPHSPLAHGWLRASHRALDLQRSLPWRPFHLHALREPLLPAAIYELEIEIWPTSIVIPAGYRLGLTLQGHDYEYTGPAGDEAEIATFKNRFTGVGPFLHDSPAARPPEIYGGETTIHFGPAHPSSILLPVIPPS